MITHAPPSKVKRAREEQNRIPKITEKRWVVPFYNKYINIILDFFLSSFVIVRYRIDIILARDVYPAILGLILKFIFGKKMIFRMKGLSLVEREYVGINSINKFLLKQCERLLFRKPDLIFPCSDNMARYVKGFGREGFVYPIPNYIKKGKFVFDERTRQETRKEMNLRGKRVFIYSGGAWKWQCLRESIKLFEYIHEIDGDTHLLILSYQKEDIEKHLASCSDRNPYTLLSVPHEGVPPYLMAGDVGFMLRAKNKLNEVASPIKFGEYLGCGLPVVVTAHAGGCSHIVRTKDFGIVLEEFEDDESLRKAAFKVIDFLENVDVETKRRISKWANENFIWEKGVESFNEGIAAILPEAFGG